MARIPIVSPGSRTGSPAGASRTGRSAGITLVTRGFGRNQNLIGQGFSLMSVVMEAISRFIELGQSGTKRALREIQEVIVWAKLIRINDKPPALPIQGSVKVKLTDASHLAVRAVRNVAVKVRSIFDDIKISVVRVK